MADPTEEGPDVADIVRDPQQSVAELAQSIAAAHIQGVDRAGTTPSITASPEQRAFLAPLVTPRGSSEPELGMPEILHGPYEHFRNMYHALLGGAEPTEPEVIAHSTKLAASLLGTNAVIGASKAIARGAVEKGAGEIASKIAESSYSGQEGFRVSEGKFSVYQNTDGDWILKGPGVIDHFGGNYNSKVNQTINFGDHFGALQDHLDSMANPDDMKPANVFLSIGKRQALAEPMIPKDELEELGYTKYFTSSNGQDKIYEVPKEIVGPSGNKWILSHDGEDGASSIGFKSYNDVHQFLEDINKLNYQLKPTSEALKHQDALEQVGYEKLKGAGEYAVFKTPNDLKDEYGTYVMTGPEGSTKGFSTYPSAIQSMGKTIKKSVGSEGEIGSKPPSTASIMKSNLEAKKAVEQYQDEIPHQSLKVFIDGKPSKKEYNWVSMIANHPENKELLDTVVEAYHAGVGSVEYGGGGGTPNVVIKFAEPKSTRLTPPTPNKYKAENAPTEMEMANWPSATRIDHISVDEAHPGPLIAYHGTLTHFINFDLSKSADIGIHFGTREQAINRIGGFSTSQTATRIIPAYLNVKNPITLPDLGLWNPNSMANHIAAEDPRFEKVAAKIENISGAEKKYDLLRNALNKLGYDSIRYENTVEGKGWSYIVWNKNTVKSATAPSQTLYVSGPGPFPSRYGDDDGRPAD